MLWGNEAFRQAVLDDSENHEGEWPAPGGRREVHREVQDKGITLAGG